MLITEQLFTRMRVLSAVVECLFGLVVHFFFSSPAGPPIIHFLFPRAADTHRSTFLTLSQLIMLMMMMGIHPAFGASLSKFPIDNEPMRCGASV